MNAAGLPTSIVIALLAGTVFIAIVVCLIVVTRLSFERRAAFGRYLGRAFLVVLAMVVRIRLLKRAALFRKQARGARFLCGVGAGRRLYINVPL